jgi:hypothetical protein
MPRPDEGLIHEWLDGELSPEESERVSRLVATDAEWAAAAAEARGLIAASSRILSALDAVPGGVMPAGSRATPRAPSRYTVRPWMRIAAGLVLVAGTSYLVIDGNGTPVEQFDRDVPTISAAPTPTVAEPRQESVRATDVAVTSAAPAPAVPPLVAQGVPLAASAAGASQPPELARERRAVGDAGAGAVGAAGTETKVPPSATGLDQRRDEFARNRQAVAESQEREARAPAPATVLADRAANAPVRAALSPQAAGARNETAVSGFAAKAAAVRALEGCWVTVTIAGADSVLVTPAILSSSGDTLVIDVGPVARPARVVRDADELRGSMSDAAGRRVAFRATRTACPTAPPPSEATPSPR